MGIGIEHKAKLKKIEKKNKDFIAEQKKLQQRLRKAKQRIDNLCYVDKQWKQKEMNHHEELKELSSQHRRTLKHRIEQEDSRSKQLTSILVEDLEETNSKIIRLEAEIMELRNKLEEKELEVVSTVKSRELNLQKQMEEKEREEKKMRENEKEATMLIESYKKEISIIEKEHEVALQIAERKLNCVRQKLEESDQKICKQKSSYEKKIQENQLNFDDKIISIKTEYKKKKIQMDMSLKKKQRDQENKYEHDIAQRDEKHCKEIDAINNICDEKLKKYRQNMEDEMNVFNVQHQKALEKLINNNKINQRNWNAQIEQMNVELRQNKDEYDTKISKLNDKLHQEKMDHQHTKKCSENKIKFLKTALKLQSFLEKIRFVAAQKKWKEKAVQENLKKENFLKEKNRNELNEIQKSREKEKKEAEIKIESLKRRVMKLECEKEFEGKRYLEKSIIENSKLQKNQALLKQLEKKLESSEEEKIRLINDHEKILQETQKKYEQKTIQQKEENIRLINEHKKILQEAQEEYEEKTMQQEEKIRLLNDHVKSLQEIREECEQKIIEQKNEQKKEKMRFKVENENLLNNAEQAERNLLEVKKNILILAQKSKKQEEKDNRKIEVLCETIKQFRTREAEVQYWQRALEEKYKKDLSKKMESFKNRDLKKQKDLQKNFLDLQMKFALREKRHQVELSKLTK